MRKEVRNLAEREQSETEDVKVGEGGRGEGCVGRGRVDPVCEINARENPVVRAVFEDVADGHSA